MAAVQRIGVVGAGQMGQGIAQVAAQAGLDVLIVDAAPDFAQAGLAKIKKQLDRLVEKAKLDAAARDQTLARLRAGEALRDLVPCDVVIEAAPEREELKLQIFKSLGDTCKDEAILASNTSSISITKIAAASGRPDRVIGMHFMNPGSRCWSVWRSRPRSSSGSSRGRAARSARPRRVGAPIRGRSRRCLRRHHPRLPRHYRSERPPTTSERSSTSRSA
jgi:hypothetical protein